MATEYRRKSNNSLQIEGDEASDHFMEPSSHKSRHYASSSSVSSSGGGPNTENMTPNVFKKERVQNQLQNGSQAQMKKAANATRQSSNHSGSSCQAPASRKPLLEKSLNKKEMVIETMDASNKGASSKQSTSGFNKKKLLALENLPTSPKELILFENILANDVMVSPGVISAVGEKTNQNCNVSNYLSGTMKSFMEKSMNIESLKFFENVFELDAFQTLELESQIKKLKESILDQRSITDKYKEVLAKIRSNIYQFETITSGIPLYKFSNDCNKMNKKVLFYNNNLQCICWKDIKSRHPKNSQMIPLTDVVAIQAGSNGKLLNKKNVKVDEEMTFCVVTAKKTFVFLATNSESKALAVSALVVLLKNIQERSFVWSTEVGSKLTQNESNFGRECSLLSGSVDSLRMSIHNVETSLKKSLFKSLEDYVSKISARNHNFSSKCKSLEARVQNKASALDSAVMTNNQMKQNHEKLLAQLGEQERIISDFQEEKVKVICSLSKMNETVDGILKESFSAVRGHGQKTSDLDEAPFSLERLVDIKDSGLLLIRDLSNKIMEINSKAQEQGNLVKESQNELKKLSQELLSTKDKKEGLLQRYEEALNAFADFRQSQQLNSKSVIDLQGDSHSTSLMGRRLSRGEESSGDVTNRSHQKCESVMMASGIPSQAPEREKRQSEGSNASKTASEKSIVVKGLLSGLSELHQELSTQEKDLGILMQSTEVMKMSGFGEGGVPGRERSIQTRVQKTIERKKVVEEVIAFLEQNCKYSSGYSSSNSSTLQPFKVSEHFLNQTEHHTMPPPHHQPIGLPPERRNNFRETPGNEKALQETISKLEKELRAEIEHKGLLEKEKDALQLSSQRTEEQLKEFSRENNVLKSVCELLVIEVLFNYCANPEIFKEMRSKENIKFKSLTDETLIKFVVNSVHNSNIISAFNNNIDCLDSFVDIYKSFYEAAIVRSDLWNSCSRGLLPKLVELIRMEDEEMKNSYCSENSEGYEERGEYDQNESRDQEHEGEYVSSRGIDGFGGTGSLMGRH